jgi:hypothetical protein
MLGSFNIPFFFATGFFGESAIFFIFYSKIFVSYIFTYYLTSSLRLNIVLALAAFIGSSAWEAGFLNEVVNIIATKSSGFVSSGVGVTGCSSVG